MSKYKLLQTVNKYIHTEDVYDSVISVGQNDKITQVIFDNHQDAINCINTINTFCAVIATLTSVDNEFRVTFK